MDAENGIIVNLHIQSIDNNEAIKTIKRKITDLDRMKSEEQKKAIKKFLEQKSKPAHGKQTMRQLMKQNAGVSNIEITDSNICLLYTSRCV